GEPQTVFASEADHLAADGHDLFARFLDIGANAGADFDHRLVHLGLHALGENGSALLEDFRVDVRAEVAGFGVDGLILFFDSDVETGAGHHSTLQPPCRFAGAAETPPGVFAWLGRPGGQPDRQECRSRQARVPAPRAWWDGLPQMGTVTISD